MSRSRKKVARESWCVTNHNVQSRYYKTVRRRYRRVCKQHLQNNWHDEDIILPDPRPFYNPWLSPADGYYKQFDYPKLTHLYDGYFGGRNTGRLGRTWSASNGSIKNNPTEFELVELMLIEDARKLDGYLKNLRK